MLRPEDKPVTVTRDRAPALATESMLTHASQPLSEMTRGTFAIAAASVASLSVAYGDFAPMWNSVFSQLPAREMWVDASALVLFVASIGLYFSRWALTSVSVIGVYLLAWLATGIEPVIDKPLGIGSLYGFVEALTSLAGASILYTMLPPPLQGPKKLAASERMVHVLRGVFGLTCVFYGWSHFVYAAYTAAMVPAWLPGRLGFAYFTGLGHIAAGIGLMVGILPRLAAALEAIMMSLFGFLVWVPSLFAQPRPAWAGTPQNQWTELVVNIVLAASAWIVADSLRSRRWLFTSRSQI